jgi:DNA-binding NarL/FixJ family response regulator
VITLTSSESDLDGLVESVSTGNFYIAPEVATRIIRAPVEKTLQPPTERSLTLRERQVVQLVAEGLTNAEIGSRLSIPVNTVRAHVRSLALKIEASSRTKIQTRARALGLVHPDRTATTRDEWNKKDARRG